MLDALRQLLDRFARFAHRRRGGYVVDAGAERKLRRAQFAAAWGQKVADDIAVEARRRALTSIRSAAWWEAELQQQHRDRQGERWLDADEDWARLPEETHARAS